MRIISHAKTLLMLFTPLLYATGCIDRKDNVEELKENVKAEILETLNNETKAAFSRSYQAWQDKWVHAPYVSKTYINFSDSTFSESLGWDEINSFVVSYFEKNPNPDPIPTLVDDINVRVYDNAAWVDYTQNDAKRGLKRETRLMEKIDGKWKIAGMHTTIYGFKDE